MVYDVYELDPESEKFRRFTFVRPHFSFNAADCGYQVFLTIENQQFAIAPIFDVESSAVTIQNMLCIALRRLVLLEMDDLAKDNVRLAAALKVIADYKSDDSQEAVDTMRSVALKALESLEV